MDEKLSMYSVGIVGAGQMACNYDSPQSANILSHAHAITISDDFRLAGIYDLDTIKRKKAASKWNTLEFSSLLELAQNSDVVCCAVSDMAHYQVMKKMLEMRNFKAVICEKPIATNISEAEELVREYNMAGIPIIVNYSRRFMDSFRETKEIVKKLGNLIVGNCYYGKGLLHNCSHMINILDFLLEISDFQIMEKVDSIIDYREDDPSIEFVIQKNKSRIFFHVVPCSITTVFQFELLFERGKISYDDVTEEIVYYDISDSKKFIGYTNYRKTQTKHAERNSALPCLYRDVKNIIDNTGANYSDGVSAVKTLKMCFKILKYK